MYLIDTNVISESRKGERANRGVRAFFRQLTADSVPVFISVVTVGELRRGVDMIRHRGGHRQADTLEEWLETITEAYREFILPLDQEAAQIWGRLRVPDPGNALDKQIAATALIHGLTVATRNVRDFRETRVPLHNPFT